MSTNIPAKTLSLMGGTPVRTKSWPAWPRVVPEMMTNLETVAHSERWAISSIYQGKPGFETRFAREFAAYHSVPYAVPTANGTSALTIILEALGIQAGDEVIVPGLTWVACASAAAGIGAIPVIVDVDSKTYAMTPDTVRDAITDKTGAILLVHPYCSAVDVDAFLALSEETGIPLVEDCSQAHGAEWRGQKLGTFGELAAFSLQQVKVLTCGEGGITITQSEKYYDLLQQLRADGRRMRENPVAGEMELEEAGSIQGRNYCMSEFHAAIALSQLAYLDEQNAQRARNGSWLDEQLGSIPGLIPVQPPAGLTRRTFYQYVVRLDPDVLGDFAIARVVEALQAELGVFVEMIDAPLNNNLLYNPLKSPRIHWNQTLVERFNPRLFDLPVATHLHETSVAFGNWALLADQEAMADIVRAFRKVLNNLHLLR